MNPLLYKNIELTDSLLLQEEIHAKDANNEIGVLKTVLNGKRNVGFIDVKKSFIHKLEEKKIGIIPVRMTSQSSMMSIIYRTEGKHEAFQLYNIAKNKGGYLKDSTPEEAREIGRLLGYNDKSIDEYISKHYRQTPSQNPDDYNDLHEQNFPAFEKQIIGDESKHELNKRLLRVVKDYKGKDLKICLVNADFVRDPNGLNFNGFTDGGTYYVTSLPGYKDNIPEDEAWIDDVFLSKPNDMEAIIVHEWTERDLMKYFHLGYDTAHAEYAENAEKLFRSLVPNGYNLNLSQKIHDKFINEYKDKKNKRAINESYQFGKIKDLFRRL